MVQVKQFHPKSDFSELGEEVLDVLDQAGSTLALNDGLAFRLMERLPIEPYLAALDAKIVEENINNCVVATLGGPLGSWYGRTLEGEVCTQRQYENREPV